MQLITDNKDLTLFYSILDTAQILYLDTEFVREKTYYPQLCLLQMATDQNDDTFLIDCVAIDPVPVLKAINECKALKIFHSGRQDLEIFHLLTNDLPKPLFDSQIAASLAGYGEQAGLERLSLAALGLTLDKEQQFTDWSKRPLSKAQLIYAEQDVVVLKKLYIKIKDELDNLGRYDWVIDETSAQLLDPAQYTIHPDDAWERLKIKKADKRGMAIAKALAAWREERAKKSNRPRGWILKDDVLLKICDKPKMVETLTDNVEVHKIVQTILKNNVTDHDIERERAIQLTPSQEIALDLMKLILKLIGAHEKIAPTLIAKADDLQSFIRDPNSTPPFMKGWRHEFFGKIAKKIAQSNPKFDKENSSVNF